MENKPEVKEYLKCPVCDCEETLVASLAAREIDKGISPDAVPRHLFTWPFVMRGPKYPIIIGSRSPAGTVFVDICKGCGIVRAIRIEIGEAMALAKPPIG